MNYSVQLVVLALICITFSVDYGQNVAVDNTTESSYQIPGKVPSSDEDKLPTQSPEVHVPADGLKASTSSAEQDAFSSISGPDVHTSTSKLGDCDFSRGPNASTHEDKEQTFSRIHTMMLLWMIFGLLTMSTIVDDHKCLVRLGEHATRVLKRLHGFAGVLFSVLWELLAVVAWFVFGSRPVADTTPLLLPGEEQGWLHSLIEDLEEGTCIMNMFRACMSSACKVQRSEKACQLLVESRALSVFTHALRSEDDFMARFGVFSPQQLVQASRARRDDSSEGIS